MEKLAVFSLIVVLGMLSAFSLFLNRRLVQSRTRYQEFFDGSSVLMIVIDNTFRVIEWNQAAETAFGWGKNEPRGENLAELIVSDIDKPRFLSSLEKAALEGSSQSRHSNVNKYGYEIFCEWQNRLLEGENGEILCMAQDITVSQKTMDELNKRSTALDGAGDAIFYTDEKGIIEFANQSFVALGLDEPSHIYGTHIGTYLFKNRMAFSALKSQFDQNNIWKGSVTKNSQSGEKVFSVTITAIYHRERLVSYVANLHDITQISCHLNTLTHRSQHDPLTGVANRSTMNDRLCQAINRSKSTDQMIALFFVDLNDFKLINDRHGHETGDKLLIEISQNLQNCLRATDTISRYGGDEFVIVVENIKNEEHVQALYTAIHNAINQPVQLNESVIFFPSASIGVARYPGDGTNGSDLIRSADQAMYLQKKSKYLNEPEPKLSADSHSR